MYFGVFAGSHRVGPHGIEVQTVDFFDDGPSASCPVTELLLARSIDHCTGRSTRMLTIMEYQSSVNQYVMYTG